MFKKGITLFNKIKGDKYPDLDIFDSESSITKDLEEENFNSIKNIIKDTNLHRTKTQMNQPKSQMLSQRYEEIKRKNVLNENKIKKNEIQSSKKIVKKEVMFNSNIPSNNNQKIPEKKTNVLIRKDNILKSKSKNKNNNENQNQNQNNNVDNQKNNDNRIKNIPISLKRVNLYRKRSLSRNSQSQRNNTEPYIHKSPYQKRKCSMGSDRNKNKLETEYNNYNNYNTNPNTIIYQSPKKANLIPKPNFKNNIVKGKNTFNTNSIYNSNKKSLKKNENEMHEIDYLTQTNEYFRMKGLSLEERIDFEYYTIKIQAFYRGYLTRKRFYLLINNCLKIHNGINLLQKIFSNKKYKFFNIIKNYIKNNNNSNNLRSKPINNPTSLQNNKLLRKLKAIENHFKNANIDNINKIIINIPNILKVTDKNLFFKRKLSLKHLITKTEFKINKILNNNFEKFKKNTLYSRNSIKEEDKINNQPENINIEELKIQKLRNLVRKKIFKNKEILHRVFIKYYYSALYIHLHWYIYVVNQLTYTQNLATPNTAFNRSESLKSDNITRKTIKPIDNNNPLTSKHSNEVDNAIRQSVRTINKINDSENPDEALRESIMCINKINDELSKEAIEKQKAERNKQLKDLVVKRLKEMKNEMHKIFTKFYYQGLLVAKQEKKEPEPVTISGNEENNEITKGPTVLRGKKKESSNALDRRNKARNLRKLMMKKEKEKMDKLRFYFYKFHSNGMLFQLRKNAKKNLSAKNVIVNMEDIINIEKKLEEKELTYMDKKIIEMEIEKEKLKQKRTEALKNIFYKTDRQYAIIKKKVFEKWNLRAKILSLSTIKNSLKKSDAGKKKKKLKKSTKSKKENKNENEVENELKEESK